MTATFETATNEIFALFKAAWDTTGHPVDYPGVRAGGTTVQLPPSTRTPWARVNINHAVPGPGSLPGQTGNQLFSRSGIFTAQIFVAVGKGFSEAYQLAKVVADAFEGESTDSAVWFRNLRISEIGRDGDWLQLNLLVDFVYDERK